MKGFLPAFYWAMAVVVLATGARLGSVERDAAMIVLLVMPILAFVTIQCGGRCARTA